MRFVDLWQRIHHKFSILIPSNKKIKQKQLFSLLDINQKILSQQSLSHLFQCIMQQGAKFLHVDAVKIKLSFPFFSDEFFYNLTPFKEGKFVSLLALPLQSKKEILGMLSFYSKDRKEFSLLEIKIAEVLASQATLAILDRLYIEKIKKIATIEKLTGLYNQSYFYYRLEEEVARASRNGCQLSLLFMDVDKLKEINDTYGHIIGDKILQLVAKSIKSRIRKMDIAFRYGGDEFVVILPQVSSEKASLIAERIRREIKKVACSYFVSLSFGVASFPQDAKEPRELLDKADQAMYQAKRKGGDRIERINSKIMEKPEKSYRGYL